MAKKNKGPHNKTKNVFKVPTTRSIKLKSKAEKMMKNLKKLDLKSNKTTAKDKRVQVDQQLKELHQEVCRSVPKKKPNSVKRESLRTNKKVMNNLKPVQTDATTALVEQMQIL